ncbi:Calpain-like protease palB/RIM13 [Exophiala dermatitidis]
MDQKRSRLETQAHSLEQSIPLNSTTNAALEATIKSAELYLQALRLVDSPSDRRRIDAKCKQLLTQAERIKAYQDRSASSSGRGGRGTVPRTPLAAPVSSRKLTTRENIILLEGAKLNGFIFKPWTSPPTPDEFRLLEGEQPFTDSPALSLSPTQLELLDSWKRPHEALASRTLHTQQEDLPSSETIMHLTEAMDLVQDMTSDCSVVASLCAATSRVERGHPKILRSIVHPYDYENDRISLSPNGKYILKLYFNGCWRRVEIDDRLPTSKTSRVLYVIDRRHPQLLWPALVEKAYLKVRGGYDFPGSNSGTDLAVLTGWIPQQVFLHDESVEPDELWEEIMTNFRNGDVLLTIGTGKLPRREQKHLGLAAEHDYAVLELGSETGAREMLIKNPWADGDVWRGASRRRPNRDDEDTAGAQSSDGMIPGTFWMDFSKVLQYFENMYINWNPGLFSHRQDLHFSWHEARQAGPGPAGNILVDNPQFSITAQAGGEIWLLANRHFRTGDYTQASAGANGYISLYLYSRNGDRVLSSEGAKVRGPFVDSPNTLLRFKAAPRATYTVVLVAQDLPPGKLNFTISAFSNGALVLAEAQLQYTHKHTIRSAWTRSNAGGNSDSADYLSNPQFRFSLGNEQRVALILHVMDTTEHSKQEPAPIGETSTNPAQADDIHVKLLVVFSDGSRITRLRPRDVLAHSYDYRRSSTVVETTLPRGDFTVICSTFDRNQFAEFTLDLYSSPTTREPPPSLTLLPADGNGRLCIKSAPAIFTNSANRLLAPLTVFRMSRLTFVARDDSDARGDHSHTSAKSSLFKMTLEQGQGPYKQVLATSEVDNNEFGTVASGLRAGDVDLQPSACGPGSGGLWLVLERLPQAGQESQDVVDQGSGVDTLRVDIFADERVQLGPWGRGDG